MRRIQHLIGNREKKHLSVTDNSVQQEKEDMTYTVNFS